MMRICPSVLNANQDDLKNEIKRVSDAADFIHLDIMDNEFVPNFTYDYATTERIVKDSTLPIDLHLMVNDADYWGPRYAEMKDYGVFSVTVHYEAISDLERTLQQIGDKGVRRGVALKPGTGSEVLLPYLSEIEMVLIMTVEPGFGGQSFMSEMMQKVQEVHRHLRELGRETTWIQVDGGIALNTIDQAARAGANTFVAGSAVYREPDPASMVNRLRQRAELYSQ